MHQFFAFASDKSAFSTIKTEDCYPSVAAKKLVNIVWFKRDLRLQDHAPLAQPIRAGQPVLLCYFLDPSVLNSPESDQGIRWQGCFLILSRVCIMLSFIDEDNPAPIVDYEKTTREDKDRYWSFRQRPEVQEQLPMIWEKLCLPKNVEQYQKQGYNLLSEKDNPLDV